MAIQKRASPISIASVPIFLSRDVIFIFKLFKLKAEGYDSVPGKGLYFIMKALPIGVAFHVPENYALMSVKVIVRCDEPY